MTAEQLAELEAALPYTEDGYSDGGEAYTDREITLMRQMAIEDFLSRQADLNVAFRLFWVC
jgi:hypothetical protein